MTTTGIMLWREAPPAAPAHLNKTWPISAAAGTPINAKVRADIVDAPAPPASQGDTAARAAHSEPGQVGGDGGGHDEHVRRRVRRRSVAGSAVAGHEQGRRDGGHTAARAGGAIVAGDGASCARPVGGRSAGRRRCCQDGHGLRGAPEGGAHDVAVAGHLAAVPGLQRAQRKQPCVRIQLPRQTWCAVPACESTVFTILSMPVHIVLGGCARLPRNRTVSTRNASVICITISH